MEKFSHVDTWVFDLDNTLYEAESHVFPAVSRKASEFIAQSLGLTYEAADVLRESYYQNHGTSWRGFMLEQSTAPTALIAHMHDIDISPVKPCPITQEFLSKLPGRKIVFTNSPRPFAERMLKHLGLDKHFDDVFTLEDANYTPKPHIDSFKAFIEKYDIDTKKSVMFEDSLANLKTAHELGMTTVWFHGDHPDADHPYVQHKKPYLHHWLQETFKNHK